MARRYNVQRQTSVNSYSSGTDLIIQLEVRIRMATKLNCFVLMSFDESRREIYDHAIRPAAEDAGFECHRADDAFKPEAIIKNIIKSIFLADVIVADISGLNPNVLYEVGVAHAVGDKTIIICELGQKLPFNLSAYRVLTYQKTIDGIEKGLRAELKQALSGFLKWEPESTNPVQDFRPVKYSVPLIEQAKLETAIKELHDRIRSLDDQRRRGELRNLMLGLPEVQFRHLKGLISPTPFSYIKRAEFLEELRRLRILELVKNKDGSTIGGIPETGDLKQHLEMSPEAREVLEELLRLVTH